MIKPWYIVQLLKLREPTPDDRRSWTECRLVGPCKTLERVHEVLATLEVPDGFTPRFYEVTRQTRSAFYGHHKFNTKDWL